MGELFKILGVDAVGAPGSTAILAMLNDAVKKGGFFASKTLGGLSGAFIPVPGKEAGEMVSFGGLFGASPIMEVKNAGQSSRFIGWGGRMLAPIHSFKN